jgi:alpha-glucosidase
MAKAPHSVRDFLRQVPSVWDDVRFVDGFPGKYAVVARRGDGRWYLAGINAETTDRTLTLSLADLPVQGSGTIITDGDERNLGFRSDQARLSADKTLVVTLKGRGGFVIVFD